MNKVVVELMQMSGGTSLRYGLEADVPEGKMYADFLTEVSDRIYVTLVNNLARYAADSKPATKEVSAEPSTASAQRTEAKPTCKYCGTELNWSKDKRKYYCKPCVTKWAESQGRR